MLNLTFSILVSIAINIGDGRHEHYPGPRELSDAVRWKSTAIVPKIEVALLLMRIVNPSKT